MTPTQKKPIIKAAVLALAGLLAACGSENAPQTKSNAPIPNSTSVKAPPIQNNRSTDRPPVDMVLGGNSYKLQNLLCVKSAGDIVFIATSADESQLMNIRYNLVENALLPESFELSIETDDTRISWHGPDLDVKKTGEKTYDISGVAKGKGWRLGSDGNYEVVPALKPENDAPFQVSFTCK